MCWTVDCHLRQPLADTGFVSGSDMMSLLNNQCNL